MAQQGASHLVVLTVLFAGFISMICTSAFPESTVTTPVTIGCCHHVDSNVHTEERMEDVIDTMKLLGLEDRVHLA